jgi:soluble lytic murein transglycosylase-like protein
MRSHPRRVSIRRLRTAQRVAFLLVGGVLTAPAFPLIAAAQNALVEQETVDAYAPHIAEAAGRFDLPAHWIRAVITVESAGDPRAMSPAGAMGLMQLMPDTWAELRKDFALGNDPYDPRDNILAGTAYLRAMYDQFGAPGFLAAYNAGPARYAEHVATGRPLPRETRAYVARLAPLLVTGHAAPPQLARTATARDWREAPLFVADRTPADATTTAAGSVDSTTAERSLFLPVRSGDGP